MKLTLEPRWDNHLDGFADMDTISIQQGEEE